MVSVCSLNLDRCSKSKVVISRFAKVGGGHSQRAFSRWVWAAFFRLQGTAVVGYALCKDRPEQSSRSKNWAAGMRTDRSREVTTEPELEQSC